MINQNLLLTGDDGYNLSKSLRFRASASAYLSRTPASAGNRKTWTWSAWVKRGTQTEQMMFGCGVSGSDDSTYTYISFGGTNADQLYVNGYTQTWRKTTQLFRDFSAWYHIVVAVDTTQATADNRIKMYVNGSQITSFATSNNPSQNTDLSVNRNAAHSISSRNPYGADSYVDGYMADINFIDGQSLTPSSFGETDPITGVWKAKKYGGTYGTNGFYLPFSDNTSTTTLGYDKSGNSNNWTTNNISLTAGTTYDSMTDVPTLTSATTANYPVLNPLTTPLDGTITNGNLNIAYGSSGTRTGIAATMAMTTGKFYWEVTVTASSANPCNAAIGISNTTDNSSVSTGIGYYTGYTANGWGYYGADGNVYNNASGTSYGATFTTNDVIGVTFDADARTLTFYKNNTSQGVAYTGLAAGTYYPSIGDGGGGATLTMVINFGQQPFSYTPPTGFVALNTFNLPEPSIKAGNKHFDALNWTGDGSQTRSLTGLNFQPDFTWMKSRSVVQEHQLYDVVRGAGGGKMLCSNLTASEGQDGSGNSDSQYGYLSSFDSAGFSVNDGSVATTGGWVNYASRTYASWNWKANGAGSSNTAGSITSTVSANPTAGFSVVTYTGNNTLSTVGHGLGASPKFIIVKTRSGNDNWVCYHGSLGVQYYTLLNTTASSYNNLSDYWSATAPSSSVFGINAYGGVNTNGATYVAYCFAEVAGYSKFGSYTGNGSTDGTFVYTGFRPKFVLWKRTDSASGNGWYLLDSARNSYNVSGERLFPNLSNAGSNDTQADFLSNGFKLRTTDTDSNASGGTYIYMAFAENPQKYSLGR